MSMISDLVKKLRWIADYDQYQNRNSEVTIRKAADTIEMLSKKARATKQEWIPCSEKLPEEPFGCLVTVEDSYFNGSEFIDCESILPYFVGWDGEQWNDDDGERCPFEVIAWMPLPEPWKGADDE